MRQLEPAEIIWAGLLGVGVLSSALLIERDLKPLTAVAHDHPFTICYFVGHFVGVWPKFLDPISLAHRAYVKRRLADPLDPLIERRVSSPAPPTWPGPGGRPPGSRRLSLRHV
jgi:hypothetical protein